MTTYTTPDTAALAVDTAPDNVMTGRRRLTLVVLLAAQFMLAVDFSILNVALPVIGKGLGFSLANLQWIVTAFALAAAGFTLLFGRVADIVGRRRLFLVGLAVLGGASLLGGLSTDPLMLMIARVAQGLATAAVTPAGLALLTSSFPEGPLRDKALGLNGALMSAGFTTGAILGGVLTDLLSWRWAFFINVPVALAVLLLAPAVIRESRPDERPKLDVPGAISVTAGLLALVYGLTTAGDKGWGDPLALGALAVGVLLLIAFYAIESRAAAPLVPVRVLKRRSVIFGNIQGLIAFVTETSLVFLMTLYLQKVLGFSPLAAGLSFGVLGVGTIVGGVAAARVIARIGTRATLITGGVLQAVATASLATLGESHGWLGLLLVATFAGGVGNMLAIVGFMVTATSGLPDDEQGMATGLATMTQQIGITMGTPIMSAIATAGIGAASTSHAVLHGVSVAVIVNSAIVLAGAVLSGIFVGTAKRKKELV
ncbi:MFS transporter [Streptantibioticus cattleyicolor]|uniref:Putative membrane transport protein n=2 Tax=Streptomycetaceae TaxID=2062 RepID=F8JVD1_STREN|nr:putative membrane transport protein [Streptantibioticus cattleyicolor NRRL 8057 = DSM 46488]MYS59060.1 MFS transporter [Streptomyces sp. SID5468]CCB74770.1 Arabinose efflux permease family protein [Streptantibioticus cattleyicolor NRRL 8057 = DSM 46488]